MESAAAELRQQLTEHSLSSADGPERTELLTMAEELEAIAAVLRARCDQVKRRLGVS